MTDAKGIDAFLRSGASRKSNGDVCDECHWHYLRGVFLGRCQDTIKTTITYAGWDGMDNGVDMRAVKVQDYTQDIETR